MPINCKQLKTTGTENARVVRMEPNVKSAKTCKLLNAGVIELAGLAKSADPTCYNAVTVKGRTGLFDIVEMNMNKLKWTRAHDRSHWVARLGLYCCTIMPPHKDWPLPMYHWEISGATFGGRGGASSLALCKEMVVAEIERCEKKLAASPCGTTNLSLSECPI